MTRSTGAKISKTQDLIADLDRTLVATGEFRARPMFGGHGLYLDGIIFGLIEDSTLYLKVASDDLAAFKAAGAVPFTYQKSTGRLVSLRYWRCPKRIMENREELRMVIRRSLVEHAKAKNIPQKTSRNRETARQR